MVTIPVVVLQATTRMMPTTSFTAMMMVVVAIAMMMTTSTRVGATPKATGDPAYAAVPQAVPWLAYAGRSLRV